MEGFKFTPVGDVSSRIIDLSLASVDGDILKFRMTTDYARAFAEQLLKRCDELEGDYE